MKANLFVVIAYLAFTVSVVIFYQLSPIGAHSAFCRSNFGQQIAPWTSGCFYRDAKQQQSVTLDSLNFEKDKLNTFVQGSGHAPNIHYYHLGFLQIYRDPLKKNFHDVHKAFELMNSRTPHNIARQVDYIHYLVAHDLDNLAQSTLDQQCSQVLSSRPDKIAILQSYVESLNLQLSLAKCKDILRGLKSPNR